MTKLEKALFGSIFIIFLLFFYLFIRVESEEPIRIKKLSAVEEKRPIVLKFSHVVSSNTPKGRAAIYFENRLEELSDGKIDVQIFPSSQLYKDSAVLKALKLNTVQMAAPSFSKFGKIVPQLALFDLPFLFRDLGHLHRVQDGVVGQKLKKMVNSKGYVALAFWDNHFKQLSSSKRPILLPKDIEGQKFRIMSSKVLEEQFNTIGANPQMMPFSEVYAALQQGVIDGQENTYSNIYTKKFYEVQKYLTISNHGYLGYLVVMSETFWFSLTPKLKADVIQAVSEATVKEREYAKELNEKQLNEIISYSKKTGKLEVFHLSKSQKDAWKEAVSKIYPVFYNENLIGENLIKTTLETK